MVVMAQEMVVGICSCGDGGDGDGDGLLEIQS